MNKKLSALTSSILFRQIASGINSDLSIKEILSILSSDTGVFASDTGTIKNVADSITDNDTLTTTLKNNPDLLEPEIEQLIIKAESENSLAELLALLADDYENTAQQRCTLYRIFSWPATIFSLLVIITAMMMIFVLPEFSAMFASFGEDLPALTLFYINASEVFVYFFPVIVIAGIVFYIFRKKIPPHFLRLLSLPFVSLPFASSYLKSQAISRLAFWLHAFYQNKEMSTAAVNYLATGIHSRSLQSSYNKLQERLANGTELGESLTGLKAIPSKLALFTKLADRSSEPQNAFLQALTLLEDDAIQASAKFERRLTLLLNGILGILVGSLVISMYLPIFKMGSAI